MCEKKRSRVWFRSSKVNQARSRYIHEQRLEALSRLNDGGSYVKAWKIDVCIFSQSGNTDRWRTKLTNQTETKARFTDWITLLSPRRAEIGHARTNAKLVARTSRKILRL